MGLQNSIPGLIKFLVGPGFAGIGDDSLDHALNFGLALVVSAFPLLIRCPKFMPV